MTDASYFVGRLYGDTEREKKDGTIITTGFIIAKVDRGDYFIIKTVGLYYYIIYKDKKWKAGES